VQERGARKKNNLLVLEQVEKCPFCRPASTIFRKLGPNAAKERGFGPPKWPTGNIIKQHFGFISGMSDRETERLSSEILKLRIVDRHEPSKTTRNFVVVLSGLKTG
jgi:hypothetical protein